MTTFQKLPKNVADLGKLIVAKAFKKLPKLQKIATSGHTGPIIQRKIKGMPSDWLNQFNREQKPRPFLFFSLLQTHSAPTGLF